MANTDDSMKPNDENKQADSPSPEKKDGDTGAGPKPIKRVKASQQQQIAATKLEIDSLRELADSANATVPVQAAAPPTPSVSISQTPAAAAPSMNPSAVPASAIQPSVHPSATPAENRTAVESKEIPQSPSGPAQTPVLEKPPLNKPAENTNSTAEFINTVNRVKASSVVGIAKTAIDLDACREVATNSVEVQVEKFKELVAELSRAPGVEFKPVTNYRNASPCSSSWESMSCATGCMRFCEKCQSIVYDFSKVEQEQAEQIVFQRESTTPKILYRRKDGKFLAKDCPVGVKQKRDRLIAVVLSVLAVSAIAVFLATRPPEEKIVVKNTETTSATQNPEPTIAAEPEVEPEPKAESDTPQKPGRLSKTKVSFDRNSYVQRIKAMSAAGTNVESYNKALNKIDEDINAGKHHLEVEQEIQELGENLGLLRRVVVEPSASSEASKLDMTEE
jgi:hypothetical protein